MSALSHAAKRIRLAPRASLFSAIRHKTDLSAVKSIGIIGAGQMGVGIAQVAINVAKKDVLILDSNPAQIERGLKFIDILLQKDVLKGKITEEEMKVAKSRISVTSNIDQFRSVDFAIEAVSENPTLKRELFANLDKILPKHAILASNTSSVPITKIAAATSRPESVIGMHFMNPVPVMKLVEIIPGIATSKETQDVTVALAHLMGKTTTVSQDMPGFIANRILMPYINEACFVLQEGIATREDIDTTMKLGTNVPMGPLTLADFIGLDTCLAIMRVLHAQLGEDKYRPSPLLVKMVDAGWLGKKAGRGFYEYPSK
ncbi:3-hydroxyacyl-CoA dehydrogenase [Polychytrium aggregatum]|uniref:3-hydroxyacyl-CoA dehydrogenase n=1 Tax=Polychytrium aggregatum TaxID=110093 RepID=UPI0022FDC033|nr:3-hydroxyacyl-CoA dehydrogenase [Polychytrium aggregatum]KAI9199491.1 3-hydroxyacyl-CoA dehydrogenase [Polychytrium aggregatum]